MDLAAWALPQLAHLLPLDEESLKQIISYTDTLSKESAADHLKNLLGDSPQALEFITNFNLRRKPQISGSRGSQSEKPEDVSEVPRAKPRKKKGKDFNKLPVPRQPDNYGHVSGAYMKKEEGDYFQGDSKKGRKEPQIASKLALKEQLEIKQDVPTQPSTSSNNEISKLPPSAAGPLISDFKRTSRNPSRNASPAPKSKTINVTGGTPMQGQSTAINDLDSAIRSLEIQTNPNLASTSQDNAKRRCNCMATRHPLLEAAPNCLNCGKIICIKEGLGPCTFCHKPLLSASEIQSMVRVLKNERGKEKMEANNAVHKRAEVSQAPRPFQNTGKPTSSAPSSDSEAEKLAAAKLHRDKLLNFQAQNARRTRIHDEAADFETPVAGQNMWASPQERALQLKRQQKVLREQEWNARPEYEKRKVVASIDLVGGKVVRRMAAMERPQTPESGEEDVVPDVADALESDGKGVFSRNPLLGSLIRPVAKIDTKVVGQDKERKSTWRRVQDDINDNEQWILDGGVYGGESQDGNS